MLTKPWILWALAALTLLALALFGGLSILPSDMAPQTPEPSTSSEAESDTKADDSRSDKEDTASDSSAATAPDASEPQDPSSSSEAATDASEASNDAERSDSERVVLEVNGESIDRAELDRAFRTFLQRYQQSYADQGRDLQSALEGPSGAYLELQIRHQAAQSLVERTLIEQRARERGLQVSQDKADQAFQQRYQSFLDEHGVTDQQLRDVFQRPNSRSIARRMLGVREASVEALKDRLRREERIRLLKKALARDLMGTDEVDLRAEETQERLRQWLQEAKADSEIVYHEPLLNAYHRESQISEIEDLKPRLKQLEKAIAAYKEARRGSNSPYIDYFLGQLYNLRVNWSSALQDEIKEGIDASDGTSSGGSGTQTGSTQLDQTIRESRSQATELLSPFDIQNEERLRRIMQADPNNPLYKYMYANHLITESDSPRWSMAIRMLNRALELNPNYVDAYVLFGDIRMNQSNHAAAVERYQQAVDAYEDAREQFRGVAKPLARRKLAEAHIARARELKGSATADAEQAAEPWERSLDQAQGILQDLQDQLRPQNEGYAAVLANLGEVAMLQERYDDAQARYRASLEVQESADVRVKLGHAYRAAQQWDEAEGAYRRTLAHTPGFARAHAGLARLYLDQGHTQQALEQFRRAFTQGDELGYEERRELALEAFQLDSDATELRIELANFYLSQNVYEGALEQFRAVLEQSDQSDVVARLGIGRVRFQRLNYDQALQQFRQALDEGPSKSQKIEIYRWIVKTQQRQVGVGNPLPQSGQESLWKLAQLYAETGQADESFRTLMDIREHYPEFRPEDVQAMVEELSDSSSGDRQPGTATADQGHAVIEPGEDHAAYATTPPTSGPHYVIPAEWGIHAQPIQDEVQLRNLAGGGVLIQYQPGLKGDTQQQLRELVQSLRQGEGRCRLVLAPHETLDAPIVLTAWTRIDLLRSYDEERIRDFVDAFIGTGPEVSEVSCSALDN